MILEIWFICFAKGNFYHLTGWEKGHIFCPAGPFFCSRTIDKRSLKIFPFSSNCCKKITFLCLLLLFIKANKKFFSCTFAFKSIGQILKNLPFLVKLKQLFFQVVRPLSTTYTLYGCWITTVRITISRLNETLVPKWTRFKVATLM